MHPSQDPDELSEILKVGYAAPPLDDVFSSNLIRQLQAEVAPPTLQPRSRQAGWAVALSCMAVAVILALIYVLYPLGTKPSRDELAMQSVPSSKDELTSFESKNTRSFQTESRQSNVVLSRGSDVPSVNSTGAEPDRGTSTLEQALESDSIPRGLIEQKSNLGLAKDIIQQDSKTSESQRQLSTTTSMSVAVMEEIEIVTKERAKKLGLSLITEVAGPDAVRITLEFEKQGELKAYGRVALEQFDGDKLLLSATLKEGQSKTGKVIVGFLCSRINLSTISLKIVATRDPSGSRVGYVLPMKDFVAL